MLGVYVGNSPSAVTDFEAWMGRPVDAILGYVGRHTWADFTGSASWAAGLWAGSGRPVLWSVPLITDDANLEAAARGDYNAYYRSVAQSLANTNPGQAEIYIRTGWEFNAQWFPWKAAGKEEAFIGAWRQFVDVFRSVSGRFKFDWSPNIGDQGMNPERAYPGDAYVDVIGLDFYHHPQWDPADPAAAWTYMVNRAWGLQWHQDFAAAHGKPTSYSEWGVTADNFGPYVSEAAAWFATHDVVYQTYWDSDADYAGRLSDGGNGATGSVFRDVFGAQNNLAITGSGASETLTGTTLDEYLDGRGGEDTLRGGAGDDTYVVDSAGDAVIENTGEGTDTVRSSVAVYTLPDQVEMLVLMGTGGQAGTGNGLANRIISGAGNDTLDGGGGDDYLMGGSGNDTFVVRPGGGRDTVADFAAGAGASDVLRFDGLGLSSFAEVRARMEAFGSDTVLSLPGGGVVVFRGRQPGDFAPDDFAFMGAPPAPPPGWRPDPPPTAPSGTQRSQTGTGGNDALTGDGRNDFLDGSGGRDTLVGGAGHDVYVVDRADDVIVENPNEGIDSVQSWSRSYTLPDTVEHLSLFGSYDQSGTGNGLANRITGGSGNDTLTGMGGDDWLTGRGGRDSFVFRPGSGHDTVTDFAPGTDQTLLDGYGFASFAAVRAAMQAAGGDTVLVLPTGDTVLFLGVAPDSFGAGDVRLAGAVSGTNRAPVVGADTVLRVQEGAVQGLGFTQPYDPDGDPLTIRITGLPGGGTVKTAAGRLVSADTVLSAGDLPGLTFTPNPGWDGAAGGFVATVSDGRGGLATQSARFEAVGLAGQLAHFDPMTYVAGYSDLAAALGTDAAAARSHFIQFGRFEGRDPNAFNPLAYMGDNPDVARAVGFDLPVASWHYVQFGRFEGRGLGGFDPLAYTASHRDLIDAFGVDQVAALRHYVLHGMAEGRSVQFDGHAYAASYPDLMAAFGADAAAAEQHYILRGVHEGRTITFDGSAYLASNPDLMAAFGYDPDRAVEHYLLHGRAEGRSAEGFDAEGYLAANPDVAAVSHSPVWAAEHYVMFGHLEGRTLEPVG